MRIFILNFFIGRHGIYSEISCCGDYSRNFADATCPVVADTPEVGKCPTDFTDLHRFFLGRFLSRRFRRFRRFFFHRDFFSSDATEFILRFPAAAITHGISQMRPVRSLQIPQRLENVPQISQIYTDFSWDVFCHADFADDADFFLMGFYSSDDTEFIRRFPAMAITHGFSRMRPVRSLQIPPEVGQKDSPEIP